MTERTGAVSESTEPAGIAVCAEGSVTAAGGNGRRTSLASSAVVRLPPRQNSIQSGPRAVNENAGGDQREGEKQAKLCESCRSDAERPRAAGEFDCKCIGELQCAEKGRAGRHERAQARCAEEDQGVGKPERQPYRLDEKPQGERIGHVYNESNRADLQCPPRAQNFETLLHHCQLGR